MSQVEDPKFDEINISSNHSEASDNTAFTKLVRNAHKEKKQKSKKSKNAEKEKQRAGLVDSDDEVGHEGDTKRDSDDETELDLMNSLDESSNDASNDVSSADSGTTSKQGGNIDFLTQGVSSASGAINMDINASGITDIKLLMKELTTERQRLRRTQRKKAAQKQSTSSPIIQTSTQAVSSPVPSTPGTMPATPTASPFQLTLPTDTSGYMRFFTPTPTTQYQYHSTPYVDEQVYLTQLQPYLDYDLYSIAWKEHFKYAKLNQQMSNITQDGTSQIVAGGSAFNEEAVRKLENYQSWKAWLADESVMRYLNNCNFMSDVFYEPIPSEENETSKEQFEEIKQQLQNFASKLDEEILQLTSETELSNSPFLEYFRDMSKSETTKRKLEEYFASQSKENSSSCEQPAKKQKQRERKEFKLQ